LPHRRRKNKKLLEELTREGSEQAILLNEDIIFRGKRPSPRRASNAHEIDASTVSVLTGTHVHGTC
jgi:hypothetical protein